MVAIIVGVKMDIRSMLQYLVKLGFTEHAIANAINANQSTVSRILSGKIKDPRGSIVIGIKYLFELELRKNIIPLKYISH